MDKKNITILRNPIFENKIYLYGSNHVSQQSCDEIKELISTTKPDQVFLECCIERWKLIESEDTENSIIKPFTKKIEPFMKFIKDKEDKSIYQKILNGFKLPLKIIQIIINGLILQLLLLIHWWTKKNKCLDMLMATEQASKINAICILGDQRYSKTMRDLICIPTYEWLKLIFHVPISFINKYGLDKTTVIDDDKLLEYCNKIKETCPILYKKFITKRDNHMIDVLSKCDGKIIVAIVGKAHVKGIKEKWSKFIKVRKEYLDVVKTMKDNPNKYMDIFK